MPFGLRLTNEVLSGLTFLLHIFDDILIASQDIKEHHDHLQQAFEILADFGFKINVNKYKFVVPQLTFLSQYGIAPVPEKVAGI